MRLLSLFALVIVSAGVTTQASTIYYYTGQDYTSVSGIATTSESVTGELTFSSPLADNLNDASVTPVSFSFNDGPVTITNAGGSFESVTLSTNASGAITGWYVFFENNPYYDLIVIDGGGEDGYTPGDQASGSNYFAENSVAGSFSLTPPGTSLAPEPSSIALLGTGLVAFAGILKRRFV
jgi:hypothetical protein